MQKEKTVKTKLAPSQIFALFGVVLIALSFIVGIRQVNKNGCDEHYKNDKQITGDKLKINTEVVDTESKRERGLSGRNCIGDNDSMLFVFETEDRQGFWMKDMNFSIDIIWLDSYKTVVHIEKNVSPESYPTIYNPIQKSLYVLEVASGLSEQKNLDIGSKLSW